MKRALKILCQILLPFTLLACHRDVVPQMEKTFTPSIRDEREAGREFSKEARKELEFSQQPDVVEYINRIGQKIVRAQGSSPFAYRFYVVKSPMLNAFAIPGGYVYVYTGLILKVQDVNQLAGVVAHEIAHVKRRHMAKLTGKTTLINLASLLAIFLARNRAMAAGAAAAAASFQLKYTRDFEREADRLGCIYMYRAGFDPQGMVQFLDRLLREQMIYPHEAPPYLLSHPLTQERINNLENLIRVNRMESRREVTDPGFHRIKALVRAETEGRKGAISFYYRRIQRAQEPQKVYHDLGLVYQYYGLWKEAVEAYLRAGGTDSKDPYLLADMASAEILLGRYSDAKERIYRALRINPRYAYGYQLLGKLYLLNDQYEEAISQFKAAARLDPFLYRAHYSLAMAYGKKGSEGDSYLHLGIYYDHMDETEKAIYYLEKALKHFGEKSQRGLAIKERLRRLKRS